MKVSYSKKHDSYTITITITTGGKITTVKGFRAKVSNYVFFTFEKKKEFVKIKIGPFLPLSC